MKTTYSFIVACLAYAMIINLPLIRGGPEQKMSKLFIKGIYEKQSKLNKPNQFRYVTNGSKNSKQNLLLHFYPVA